MDEEKAPERVTFQPGDIQRAIVGESPRGKRLLDPDVVKRMKEAGLPKPPDVLADSWNQVQHVKVGAHTMVAHMAACGCQPKQIADATGLNISTVKNYLNSEKIKFEIKKLQHQMFAKDPIRRFKGLVEEATTVLEETMHDKNAKPSVRMVAADKILDRALGKPKQFLSVEGSLIRRIYESLDDKKPDIEGEAVTLSGEKSMGSQTEEKITKEVKEIPSETVKSSADWGSWLKDNL